jgi:predicted nucleic acid-binding protein
MNCYADTSFLLSLYREQSSSRAASATLTRVTRALPLTPLIFLEMRNGLHLAQFRGEIDATTRQAAWAYVEQDIRDGILAHVTPSSVAVYAKAAELSDRHGATIGTRTLDVLHVAAALVLGTTRFFSFDLRQRALAEKAGLKVEP